MLKLQLGGFWVVLQRCRLNGRHVESGHNAVHFEGGGCCKEHGIRSLPARFKVLGLIVLTYTELPTWNGCKTLSVRAGRRRLRASMPGLGDLEGLQMDR